MRILACVFLGIACMFAVGAPVGGQGYAPPAPILPSDEVMKQIQEKGNRLAQALTLLQKQGVRDVLVDVAVYLRRRDARPEQGILP